MAKALTLIAHFVYLTAAPLKHLGPWSYLAVFLIAFVESLVILGSFIPGSVGLIFAGFLAARGLYSFPLLLLSAAIGGIIGDAVSFYLGAKGAIFFTEDGRWLKKSQLDRAKKFFADYGDKSILVGRFAGVLRPFAPFVAGLSQMDRTRFWAWNTGSAFVWVLFHMSLGYFFATSLKAIERWSTWAGIALLGLALVSALLIAAVQRRHRIKGALAAHARRFARAFMANTYLGAFLERHPGLGQWWRARMHRHRASGLPLTILVIVGAYFALLFAGIAKSVVDLAPITAWDARLVNILHAIHSRPLADAALFITSFGGPIVVSGIIIVSAIVLVVKKKRALLPGFATAILLADIFSYAGKLAFARPRPPFPLIHEYGFSFPSMHAALSCAVYGFIAYAIAVLRKGKGDAHAWAAIVLAILIILIGASRIILGVHYMSDVLAGFALGGLSLVAGVAVSEYFLARTYSREE